MNLVELGQRSVNFVTRGFEKAAANPSMQAGLAIPVGLASTIAIDAALYQSQTQHIIHQDMPSLSDQVVIEGSAYKLSQEAKEQQVNPYVINKMDISGSRIVSIVTTLGDQARHIIIGDLSKSSENFGLTEVENLGFIPFDVAVSQTNPDIILAIGTTKLREGYGKARYTFNGEVKTAIEDKNIGSINQAQITPDGKGAILIVADLRHESLPGLAYLDFATGKITVDEKNNIFPMPGLENPLIVLPDGSYETVGTAYGKTGYYRIIVGPQGVKFELEYYNPEEGMATAKTTRYINIMGQEVVLFVNNALTVDTHDSIVGNMFININNKNVRTVRPDPSLCIKPEERDSAQAATLPKKGIQITAAAVDEDLGIGFMAITVVDYSGQGLPFSAVEVFSPDNPYFPQILIPANGDWPKARWKDEMVKTTNMRVIIVGNKKLLVANYLRKTHAYIDNTGIPKEIAIGGGIVMRDITDKNKFNDPNIKWKEVKNTKDIAVIRLP